MDFAGYQIPECNVSFDALPSLLVEYCPRMFEGWEVVPDYPNNGFWFQCVGGCRVLYGNELALVLALCTYLKCDVFVWCNVKDIALHFVEGHTPLY